MAIQGDQAPKAYLTDLNGATPKLLPGPGITVSQASFDGQKFFTRTDEGWVIESIASGASTPVMGLKEGEFPIAWAADEQHLFTETRSPGGLSVAKVEIATGKREEWMEWTPKSQVGLAPWKAPISITPDGRWMTFTYGTQLGQFYRSENVAMTRVAQVVPAGLPTWRTRLGQGKSLQRETGERWDWRRERN